jgi:hypothetical protein
MFTGLVQHVGRIAAVAEAAAGQRWSVEIGAWWPCGARGIVPGDSI